MGAALSSTSDISGKKTYPFSHSIAIRMTQATGIARATAANTLRKIRPVG